MYGTYGNVSVLIIFMQNQNCYLEGALRVSIVRVVICQLNVILCLGFECWKYMTKM